MAVKNRYLNISDVIKFAKTQNEPKQAERKQRKAQQPGS